MNSIVIIITGGIAALVTFYININLKLGAVKSSAGISLLGGLFFYFFPGFLNSELSNQLPAVIMGASFIGMASKKVISSYWVIGLSGLIFSIIFSYTSNFFEGYGGSLGTTAAISLCATFILLNFKRKRAH